MFFIIAVAGTVLFSQGLTITTAADAAEALRPLAGTGAFALFAIGIIGTGMLAIPVLAGSASYAFSEAFGLKEGLDKKLKQAYGFYGVIILSMLIGLGINFLGIDPIKALIFSAVLNGLISPVLLILIMLVGGNKEIMGKWKNGPVSTILGWLLVIIMTLAGIATIISLF
jgi:Mn2+/Fe2+ NRAMP family transporter